MEILLSLAKMTPNTLDASIIPNKKLTWRWIIFHSLPMAKPCAFLKQVLKGNQGCYGYFCH